jgi:hypothetical protein
VGCEERIELDVAGEVVDRADEAGEGAFGDDFQDVVRGRPGGVRRGEDVVVDPATAEDDGSSQLAVEGVVAGRAADLVEELCRDPEIVAARQTYPPDAAAGPVIDVRFDLDVGECRFFSVVSTIGTPLDITAQEIRVEAFYPSDTETRERWLPLVAAV